MPETRILSVDQPGVNQEAAAVLAAGGLVSFPTDTVYGLAASLESPQGLHRLYTAKGRPENKAIPVLAASAIQAAGVATAWPEGAIRLASSFWPGALTLVLNGRPDLPREVCPEGTVGLRVPDHPAALALLELCGPLAVTSANLSGRREGLTAKEVLNQLAGRIDLILDGGMAPGGVASTVVRLEGGDIILLRPGPLSFQQLIQVFHR